MFKNYYGIKYFVTFELLVNHKEWSDAIIIKILLFSKKKQK